MEALDDILKRYTDPSSSLIHGVAFIAVDRLGRTIYKRAAGRININASTDASPMRTDALCWIASMTKIATAVATMQLVERGLIQLDDDVRVLLPELGSLDVLERISDSGQPVVRETFNIIIDPLTYPSQLLTHSSGFVYDSSSPLLQQWSKLVGREAHTFCGSMDGYRHPLLFDPGQSWGYGCGADWAGQIIEKISGMSLEEFMRTNMWDPLRMTSTTFHPHALSGSSPPQLEMALRTNVDGTKSVTSGDIMLKYPLQDDLGGIGLFSTPEDFTKLLSCLLTGGHPILDSESVHILFEPQLSNETRAALPGGLGHQLRRVLGLASVASNKVNDDIDYCLAGALRLTDVPSRRRKGTVSWSGLPNLHWWIDREEGIAATLFTQMMPPRDPVVIDLLIDLEKALYDFRKDGSRSHDLSKL